MNSNNTKTLIITQALAARLLVAAGALKNTDVENVTIHDTDGFKVTHEHAEYGPQCLLVDRINASLFTVSFAGRQEFLDAIGTDGWASCAEALENYLRLENEELGLEIDDLCYYEVGDSYVVYHHKAEVPMLLTLEDLRSQLGLVIENYRAGEVAAALDEQIAAAVEKVVETITPTIDEATAEVIEILERTEQVATDETVADTVTEAPAAEEPKVSFRERTCQLLRRVTPRGKRVKAALGGAAVGLVVAGGILLAKHYLGDVADVVDAAA